MLSGLWFSDFIVCVRDLETSIAYFDVFVSARDYAKHCNTEDILLECINFARERQLNDKISPFQGTNRFCNDALEWAKPEYLNRLEVRENMLI